MTHAMPPAVAALFRPLHNELLEIHQKWSQYRQMFGHGPDRIELLNRFAHVFFGYAQLVFYDDLLLALFRFTDRVATCEKHNLTLERLADAVATDDPAY